MKRVYTARDIISAVKGDNKIYVNKEERFTDLAKEYIKKNNIEVIIYSEVEINNSNVENSEIVLDSGTSAKDNKIDEKLQEIVGLLKGSNYMTENKSEPEYDLLIKNGSVIIPEIGLLKSNLVIKGDKIFSITQDEPKAKEVIDAKGLHIIPGILDPHTHLGLMASLDLELETEGRAAILGGVTTVGCFFNHEGSYKETINNICNSVKNFSRVDFIPHLTLRDDIQVSEIEDYINYGVKAFKMYMCGIPGILPHQEDGFIYNTLKKISTLQNKPLVCIHAENTSIVDYAVTDSEREKINTLEDWEKTHPSIAEAEAIQRASYLSECTDTDLYIVHVSSEKSVNKIQELNNKKVKIETTSPYLTIDVNSDIGVYGKMSPPLRNLNSRNALWHAIENGLIDTIGTDNVTMTSDEKNVKSGMKSAVPGYPAIATHLVSVINEGVINRGIPIEKIIPLMTLNPAKIFGVYPKKGTLLPGSDADIVLLDLNRTEKVSNDRIQGRSDFSLFDGKYLKGWPCATIKAGKIVAWNGEITDDIYRGKVLRWRD